MSTLVFMVGCPASGKSTIAEKMSREGNAVVVSSDMVRKELFGDENCQDSPNLVFNRACKIIANGLYEGHDVVFDATNLHKKDRSASLIRTMTILSELGGNKEDVNLEAVLVRTDLTTCLERNRSRERHVPEDVLTRMWQASEAISDKTLRDEGFSVTIVNNNKNLNVSKPEEKPRDEFLVMKINNGLFFASCGYSVIFNLLVIRGDVEASELYHRLKYEDYCREHGKRYEDLDEYDIEKYALDEAQQRENEIEM